MIQVSSQRLPSAGSEEGDILGFPDALAKFTLYKQLPKEGLCSSSAWQGTISVYPGVDDMFSMMSILAFFFEMSQGL